MRSSIDFADHEVIRISGPLPRAMMIDSTSRMTAELAAIDARAAALGVEL